MSIARSGGMIGLAGLGLWLLSTAPVNAGQTLRPGSRADSSRFIENTLARMADEAGTGNVQDDCSFRGIKLAGKVKIVDSFPDIRVKAVSSFPDIKVKKVTSFADECGEWQMVDSFPDFKIQFVDSFPDVEVAWVESFPGLP